MPWVEVERSDAVEDALYIGVGAVHASAGGSRQSEQPRSVRRSAFVSKLRSIFFTFHFHTNFYLRRRTRSRLLEFYVRLCILFDRKQPLLLNLLVDIIY